MRYVAGNTGRQNDARFAARQVRIYNNTGGVIPRHSFCQITGIETSVARAGAYTVIQPIADDLSATMLIITGAGAIPNGKVGLGMAAFESCLPVAYSGTIPASGDSFGTVAGQWYGQKDKAGFGVLGSNSTRVLTWCAPGGSGVGTGLGDTIPEIVSAAGALGNGSKTRRDDTVPGLKLYATNPGLEFKAADAGLSAIYTATPSAIARIADDAVGEATGGAGLAHVGHQHQLWLADGLEWAGTGQTCKLVVKVDVAQGTGFVGGGANDPVSVILSADAGNSISKKADGLYGESAPDPGSIINKVTQEGSSTVGASADYSRTDHAHDLLLFAGAISAQSEHSSGLYWEDDSGNKRLGLRWELDANNISDIVATASHGGIRRVALSDHVHRLVLKTGGGLAFISDQLSLEAGSKGDILYYTGTAWAKLAIGSDDYVLTVATDLPAWEAASDTTYTASNGLVLAGTVFSVDLASDPGLEFSGGDLRVKIKASAGIGRGADGLYAVWS